MAIVFPRFSSLDARHFRAARFGQLMAELCREAQRSRELVEHQFLSAVVLIAAVAYLLARMAGSSWMMLLILPVVLLGGASLQHALTLYRHHLRVNAMPALCEALGRLRHTVGHAPDLALDRLVRARLLPPHRQCAINDVVFGDYRGHRLTLAMVSIRVDPDDFPFAVPSGSVGGEAFRGVVVAIPWPKAPERLPADELTRLIEGRDHARLAWLDGQLTMTIPCQEDTFEFGSLFDSPARFGRKLERAARIMQIPHRLIDHLLEERPEPIEAT